MDNNRHGSYFQEMKLGTKQAIFLISWGKGSDQFGLEGYQKCHQWVTLSSSFPFSKWCCFVGLPCPFFTTGYWMYVRQITFFLSSCFFRSKGATSGPWIPGDPDTMISQEFGEYWRRWLKFSIWEYSYLWKKEKMVKDSIIQNCSFPPLPCMSLPLDCGTAMWLAWLMGYYKIWD